MKNTDNIAAYVGWLERENKRLKQQLNEHIASEKEKELIIEELLNGRSRTA